MPRSVIGAWRGFSTLVQVGAVAQAVNSLMDHEGDFLDTTVGNSWMNDKMMTGTPFPTAKVILSKKMDGKHKTKATPHTVGMFASLVMGKDTLLAMGTATKHTLTIDLNRNAELPKRTAIEYDGSNQWKYTGVSCGGISLSCKRGDLIDFEADLLGTGLEESDTSAKPVRLNEPYLTYGDAKIMIGGAWSGSAYSGGAEISANVENWKFSIKNGASAKNLMGDQGKEAASIRRGSEMYTGDLEAQIELEAWADGYKAQMFAGAEFGFSIPISGGPTSRGGPAYQCNLIFPRLSYKEANKGKDSGIVHISPKFQIMTDPALGDVIIEVVNLFPYNYLATA